MNSKTCLTAEQLQQLSRNDVSPSELNDIEQHVSDCDRCRELLDSAQSDAHWQDEIVPILQTQEIDGQDRAEIEPLDSVLRLLGPTDDPHMLGRVSGYEVVGVIGRGGMGVVFKAFEPPLNRYVAIKMLLPHLAASGAARKRFAREAQAAAAVIDDHVLPIYSVAEWQGVPYLVTQYSRSATLQQRIQDRGPLELKEILRIGMQTARGLAAAHAQGIVHRDVKPSNILLDAEVERALLTDFGLARAVDDASITRTGIIAGTPQYMSPEQARGGSVDARSDLFSLGSVLYAMCTGRPPFRADNSHAVLRLITDEEPSAIREINPDIPNWLCTLVSRLMAKSPDARFERAADVAEALEQCLAHVQQPSTTRLPNYVRNSAESSSINAPAGKKDGKTQQHSSLNVGVVIMFAALVLGFVSWLSWPGLIALNEGADKPTQREGATDETAGANEAAGTTESDGAKAETAASTTMLDGTWAFVSLKGGAAWNKIVFRSGERYVFKEDRLLKFTVNGQGLARLTERYMTTLDTETTPHRLTFKTTSADKVALRSIFEVDGDVLRICFFAPTEADGRPITSWPTEFSLDKGRDNSPTLLTLRRVSQKQNVAANAKAGERPDDPAKAKTPQLPSPAIMIRPLELRLGYLEPGDGRTKHMLPGGKKAVYVSNKSLISVTDVAARTMKDSNGEWAIELQIAPDEAKRIQELTKQHLNKPLAILVGGKLLSAPRMQGQVGSKMMVTGRFSQEQAERLVLTIELATAMFRQSVSDLDAEPVWGEPVEGIQLAVTGIKQGRRFKPGDTIRFRLSVRNAGDKVARIKYRHSKMCYWVAPSIEKPNGERVRILQTAFRGGHKTYTETLEPDAVVALNLSGILVLGASENAPKLWPKIENPVPGEYRLRAGWLIHPLDADGNDIIEPGTRRTKYFVPTSGSVTIHFE